MRWITVQGCLLLSCPFKGSPDHTQTHAFVPMARWITLDAFLLSEMKCSSSAAVVSPYWQPEGLFDQWFIVKSNLQSSKGLQKWVLWLLIWVGLQLFALVLVKAAMPNSFAYAFQIQLNKNKTLIRTIGFDLVLQNKSFKWFPYYLAKPGT